MARGSSATRAMQAAYRGDCETATRLIRRSLHEPKKTKLKAFAASYKFVAKRCGLPLRGAGKSRRRGR